MFCENCGKKLPDGATVCEECGAKVTAPAPVQEPVGAAAEKPVEQPPEKPVETPAASEMTVTPEPAEKPEKPHKPAPKKEEYLFPRPGYSDQINAPEIVSYLAGKKKKNTVLMCVLSPLPLILSIVLSFVIDGYKFFPTALLVGLIPSVLILLFFLWKAWKISPKRYWEGAVVGKGERVRTIKAKKDRPEEKYVEYILTVKTEKGLRKKIVEDDRSGALLKYYRFFEIGDRLCYHPGLPYPYEKRDNERDRRVICVFCGSMNEGHFDRCINCGKPLLK